MRPPRPFNNYDRRQFQPHVPFDMAHCEPAFPRVSAAFDDKALTELLIKRNTEISSTGVEQTALATLASMVTTSLDGLIAAPDTFEAAIVEEKKMVGSYKQGTMLTGSVQIHKPNSADMVIILRTLPTKQAVAALSQKICDDIKSASPKQVLSMMPTERGFNMIAPDATLHIMITTIPPNIKKLEPTLHLPAKMMSEHLASIRHARWFEENASHASIKMLIRLLKDIRLRIPGLRPLTPWMIDLLSHHAVMSNPTRTPLAINIAFRRVFSLLSSGIFLPGSIGILDPCEMGTARVHVSLSLEEMDALCMAGQTILRIIGQGGFKQVLDPSTSPDFMNMPSQWAGVIVSNANPIYVPPIPDIQAQAVTN